MVYDDNLDRQYEDGQVPAGVANIARENQTSAVPRETEDRAEKDLVAFEQTLPNVNFQQFRVVDQALKDLQTSVRDRSVSAVEREARVNQDITDLKNVLPKETFVQRILLKDIQKEVGLDAAAERRLAPFYDSGALPRPGQPRTDGPTNPGDGTQPPTDSPTPPNPGTDLAPLPPLPPCPPGFDATKWNNPDYHSDKYDVGRNYARIRPLVEALPDEKTKTAFVESFLKTQGPVLAKNGSTLIDVRNEVIRFRLPDGRVADVDTVFAVGGDRADHNAPQWLDMPGENKPFDRPGTPLTPDIINTIRTTLTPEQLRNPLVPAEIRGTGTSGGGATGGGTGGSDSGTGGGTSRPVGDAPLTGRSGNGADYARDGRPLPDFSSNLPPCPPGFDATKWNDPNYHSFKYDVGRNYARVRPQLEAQPTPEAKVAFAENFLKTQIPVIERLGGRVIDIKDEKLLFEPGDGTRVVVDTIFAVGGNEARENAPQWLVEQTSATSLHKDGSRIDGTRGAPGTSFEGLLPPAPGGFDSTKWDNPNYHSFKYDLGRDFARRYDEYYKIQGEAAQKAYVENYLRTRGPGIVSNLGGRYIDSKNEVIRFATETGDIVDVDFIYAIGGTGPDENRLQWLVRPGQNRPFPR